MRVLTQSPQFDSIDTVRYESFIAKRYLFSKRKFTFINIISLLATLGIAFGVAALIIVMSVFNGFNNLVTSILLDFDPHLKIEKVKQNIDDHPINVDSVLKANASIVGESRFIQRKAMLVAKDYNMFVWMKGVETEKLQSVSNVKSKLVLGSFDLDNKNSIVLGITLADKMRVLVGDTVTVYSSAGLENILSDQFVSPTVMRFRVAGIYQSDNKMYDDRFAFLSLSNAQTLFRMGNDISGYEMRLNNIDQSESEKKNLQNALGDKWTISTWYDLHKDLYSVMKIERWSAFAILCVIVVVAMFNIFASLNMLVLEKQRDIGVLQSMGATPSGIHRIFLYDGLLVGVVGIVSGVILGLSICVLQIQFKLIKLDSAFIIPALPVEIRFSDIFIIVFSTIILCAISALYPASKAKRVIPIEAIRWE